MLQVVLFILGSWLQVKTCSEDMWGLIFGIYFQFGPDLPRCKKNVFVVTGSIRFVLFQSPKLHYRISILIHGLLPFGPDLEFEKVSGLYGTCLYGKWISIAPVFAISICHVTWYW